MRAVKHFGKIFLNLFITFCVLLLLIYGLPKVLVFFMPFVIGGIIAFCASPLVHFLEKRFKMKRKAGSVITIVLAIGLVALAIYGIGYFLLGQLQGFLTNLPQMWVELTGEFELVGEKLQVILNKLPKQVSAEWMLLTENLQKYAGDFVGSISLPTMERVSEFAKNVPGFLVNAVMTLLSAYFFVANKEEMQVYYTKYVPDSLKEKCMIVCRSLKRAFGGYVIAQLKIEVWMYLLLFIGLKIAGVNYASLVALGIAFLDLLPVFGTGTVLVPWGVVKLIGGHYTTAVILLCLWGIGQLVRQMIQPKFVGESLGMPAIPTLFLLFIGWQVNGVWGMILAVPIGLVFLNLYREGVFDTTRNSIQILMKDLSTYRKYTKDDFEFYKRIEKKEIEKEDEL